MNAPKRYHTAAEIAEYLGLRDASAVRRYARQGVIPSARLGKKLLFKLEDVDRALGPAPPKPQHQPDADTPPPQARWVRANLYLEDDD